MTEFDLHGHCRPLIPRTGATPTGKPPTESLTLQNEQHRADTDAT